LHFPWARAPQALPGTSSAGARTFLPLHQVKAAIVRPAPRAHLKAAAAKNKINQRGSQRWEFYTTV